MGWDFGAATTGAFIAWMSQRWRRNPWADLDSLHMVFMNRSEPDGAPMRITLWEGHWQGGDDARDIATMGPLMTIARPPPTFAR